MTRLTKSKLIKQLEIGEQLESGLSEVSAAATLHSAYLIGYADGLEASQSPLTPINVDDSHRRKYEELKAAVLAIYSSTGKIEVAAEEVKREDGTVGLKIALPKNDAITALYDLVK